MKNKCGGFHFWIAEKIIIKEGNMTVLTIRAQDTATAMDEIVEKLGKDSFIIGTKK